MLTIGILKNIEKQDENKNRWYQLPKVSFLLPF